MEGCICFAVNTQGMGPWRILENTTWEGDIGEHRVEVKKGEHEEGKKDGFVGSEGRGLAPNLFFLPSIF